MKKSALLFGGIIGLLLCINLVIMIHIVYNRPETDPIDALGYLVFVLIFSLAFFGTRYYRNQFLDGYISFGKAFKTSVLIAFVGCTIYVVVWLFFYYLFVPDFEEVFAEFVINGEVRRGATPEELEAKTKQLEAIGKVYQNPIYISLLTYLEVFPIGLVVSLVSALILKKKPALS
jgi:hypothetical protein